MKENWFRVILGISILIIALSFGYYLINSSTKATQEVNKSNVLVNQQNCAAQAAKAFTEEGYDPKTSGSLANYTNHYNQRLNKCFIEIYDQDSNLSTIYLTDAYELKEYASYFYLYKGNNGASNPVCSLDEQILDNSAHPSHCNSEADFNAYVDSYMND